MSQPTVLYFAKLNHLMMVPSDNDISNKRKQCWWRQKLMSAVLIMCDTSEWWRGQFNCLRNLVLLENCPTDMVHMPCVILEMYWLTEGYILRETAFGSRASSRWSLLKGDLVAITRSIANILHTILHDPELVVKSIARRSINSWANQCFVRSKGS